MKQRIIASVLMVTTVCGVLIAGVMLVPKRVIDRYVRGVSNDTTILRDRSAEFAAALKTGRYERAYRLFNAAFRAEVPLPDFSRAVRDWIKGRRVNRVLTTHVELRGVSGLISSNVYYSPLSSSASHEDSASFPRTGEDFLFQYWLRTSAGWELMWLNKALDPIAMDYGRKDTIAMYEIMQLALEEIILQQGLENQTGLVSMMNYVVLLSRTGTERRLTLPDRNVLWLSDDSIRSLGRRRKLDYYIDVQQTRVINDVALGTFDIIPLAVGGVSRRRRSVKLFFTKRQGQWSFAGYGAGW